MNGGIDTDLLIPIIAGLLIILAIPSRVDGQGKLLKTRSLPAKLCDAWTIFSSVVIVAAWAMCDLHFDGRKQLLSNSSLGSGGPGCYGPEVDPEASYESDTTCDENPSSNIESVSEAISEACSSASLILGTSMILEFFQVIAHRAVGTRSSSEGGQKKKDSSIYTLYDWHDSECLLLVYSILFVVHIIMTYDREGHTWGLIFADPVAAADGHYRPISTIRYVEWSLASPLLMSLVGRSIPRKHSPGENEKISETLRPALVVTTSYIFVAWMALPVIDFYWRWALIFVSFIGYCFATLDQMTTWKVKADETATCAVASGILLNVQILVYLVYGIVYLLPLWGLLDPISEQAALTYADSTVKLACSAFLASMRHAESLAESKRERAKADTLASELNQIIENANAPIFAVDTYGHVTLWNEKLAVLTGSSLADVVGKPLTRFVSPECRQEVQSVLDDRKRGKCGNELFHCDMNTQSQDANGGQVVTLLMTATARHDAKGAFVGIVGVGQDLTDITRIKVIEEKKNQLLAMVSHELKSPLHGIIGLAESLSQSEQAQNRKSQLRMVKSCATRLLDLVSNIMQMSRLARDKDMDENEPTDFGKEKLRKDPIDMTSIISEVCMLVTNATDKANRPILNPLVKFANNVAMSSGPRLPLLEGDAYKITQVFFNLLTNACKFCTHGSITIDATVNRPKRMIEVSISDTGVGISPENIKRIFEPFEQENNSSERSFGGIGLGLAISKQVVELHDGSISVFSTPGKGSQFIVSLPVTEEAIDQAMALPPPEYEITTLSRTRSIGSVTVHNPKQRRDSESLVNSYGRNSDDEKFTILSVDDDVVNQEVIKTALSDHYEIHIAMNGFEALEYFATRSKLPDLVLLDIMMPGMDGFEVLKNIRNEKNISRTTLPVIMLSAMDPIDKAVIEGLKSGANDYVSKPFDPDILKARVKTQIEMKRLRSIENESFHYSKLLHDILPVHIIDRLVLGEKSISEGHDSVCMLFSDIVGWTPMSESVPTHQLIDLLNELFSSFDELTEKHGVFKAETIGDCYIVAAGHEGDSGPSDATLRVTEFAIEMLEKVKEIKPPDGMQLQIRVGVHTGPAYSGVVGTKVPKYTFFGDTVNTAARMESMGLPGCVNLSSSACHNLESEVSSCRSGRSLEGWLKTLGASVVKRDPVEVKGKGMMDMFVLCPKGVSAPLVKRLSKSLHSNIEDFYNPAATRSGGPSSKRLSDSWKSLQSSVLEESSREEAKLKIEMDLLKKKCEQLEASERAAWAVMETPQLNAMQGVRMTGNQPFLARKQSSNTSLTASAQGLSTQSHQTEELKLQLLATTKSLMRARQALLDKDAEMDEMELRLQRAQRQPQSNVIYGRSIDLSDSISVRSSFISRTQELLETLAEPMTTPNRASSLVLHENSDDSSEAGGR